MGWIRIDETAAPDAPDGQGSTPPPTRPAVELLCRRTASCLHCAWRMGDNICLIHPGGIPREKLTARRDHAPPAVSCPIDEEKQP